MLINHCPACWCVNANEALCCVMCGADLNMADATPADTIRLPLEPRARRASASALWLDDLVGPRVSPVRLAEPDAQPINLTLRDIGTPAAPESPPSAESAPATALVQSDGMPQSPLPNVSPSVATATATPTPGTTPPPALRPSGEGASRAERRAAVRRDRRTRAPVAPHASGGGSEVLVVGDSSLATEQLCGLLADFGFAVHTTAAAAEALARCASPALLASFVLAEMSDGSGGNGIDLCGRLRQASPPNGDHVVLLVLVATQLRPMDRVRAELAGCDEAIPAPVSRGSVARLLDARGIRLPSDPRRA